MPLPAIPAPPAWELFLPPTPASSSGLLETSALPAALIRPLAPLLGQTESGRNENFLSGLRVNTVLGVASLPASKIRRVPLIWLGVTLLGAGLFKSLRGGCWVCGFPAVGRGRELLRLGNLADHSGWESALRELGQTTPGADARLYFNFHYDEPEAACERAYVLDEGAGCLHGFAFPRSALAPAKLK